MTHWEKGEAVREAVYEPEPSLVARLLVLVNFLCFAAGIVLAARNDVSMDLYVTGGMFGLSPEQHQERQRYSLTLQQLGGVSGWSFAAGEWWRLLTYAFVHMGLPHLVLNMFSLLALGRFAEKMWGPVRFFLLFLLSAVGGGALALIHDPASGLVGASGGNCGILAAFGVWVFLNREHLPAETLLRWTQLLVVNAVLIGSMGAFVQNVSNTGHLGGAALGAVLGGLLSVHRFGNTLQRWLAALGVVAVPALCVGYLFYNFAHDDKWRNFRHEPPPHANSADLAEHFLPRAQRAEAEADALYVKEVFPLLGQDPAERDPQAVKAAIEALRQAASQLLTAARELHQQAGPYPEFYAEQVRLRRAEHLRVKVEFFEELMTRLEKGDQWTIPDGGPLESKRWRARELNLSWRAYLNAYQKARGLDPKANSPAP